MKNTHVQKTFVSWLVLALFVGAITCAFVCWLNVPDGDLSLLKILRHAPVPSQSAPQRQVSHLVEHAPLPKPPIPAENLNHALRQAANDGDLARVKRCLARGADVNGGEDMRGYFRPEVHGGTPLAFAVCNNHTEVVRYLLAHGASVKTGHYEDVPYFVGTTTTPLMGAAAHRNLTVVRLLLQHGARAEDKSKFGTALAYAVERPNNLPVIRTLVANGCDVDEHDQYETVLQRAAESGDARTVRYLIRMGARVNAIAKWNDTALLVAAREGHLKVAQVLLEHGAKIDYYALPAPSLGGTALMQAAREGQLDMVRLLLDHGARVNFRVECGEEDGIIDPTALALARLHKHNDIVKLLKRHGARELSQVKKTDIDEGGISD